MKKQHKRIGFYVEIGSEERVMLDALIKKHSLNLSQFVRNAIREKYNALEDQHEALS